MVKQLATTLLAILVAACATSEPTPERSTVTSAEPLVAPVTAASPVDGDWRTRVRVHVAELRTANPALHAELAQLAPTATRAGFLRFASKALHDPHAAAVFLDRLVNGGESEPVRAALVEALPRTGGLYADAVIDLIATETAASVRAAYVHSARRAPADQAIAVFERGLADADPAVTFEAARSVGAHADGARLADALQATLASTDGATRAAAARSLGILRVATARTALLGRLGDSEADVRLESLRALDRIAPGSMKDHAAVARMASDPDPRITQLAARLGGAAATRTP